MRLRDAAGTVSALLRYWLGQATEPYILFPAITVLVLGVIWGTTLNLIDVERVGAERATAAASRELAETYEAQIVRALREIDHTLKLVKYTYERKEVRIDLSDLKSRDLLPQNIVFAVSIADATGNIVASTRPSGSVNAADLDLFQRQRRSDTLTVGQPLRSPGSQEWKLQFSRRLDAADGTFDGVVMVTVDAAYFVSGYESSKLGDHGVLGIVGTDGVFRVRRTGESVFAGDIVDYASVTASADQPDSETVLSANAWDGIRRYISVRRLFDFPLAVIVGLAEEEQLVSIHRNRRTYLWLATAGSFLLILVVTVLARMSWQLAQNRLRAIAEHIAHGEHLRDHANQMAKRIEELKTLNDRLEEAQILLIQAEKMSAVGQLAAGIAHEINNPVGFVNSNLGTLEKYVSGLLQLIDTYRLVADACPPGHPTLLHVDQVRQEIDIDYVSSDISSLIAESRDGLERIKRIVADLKDFSRLGESKWQLADVHKSLDSTLNVVTNEIKYKANVVKEYGVLPEITCMPFQLNQVFMNLLVNAAHAIKERGTIMLRTGFDPGATPEIVWIEVEDNGSGIPAENIKRIFEPFFTTKPVGSGTGLGLSVSYGIVKRHQGRIDVRSEPGKGTVFRVTLPINPQQADESVKLHFPVEHDEP